MIKEVCIENFTDVSRFIKLGADRFELNSDLAAGGLTPSFGVIKKTVEVAHQSHISVETMIRPRGGNFVYSDNEIAIMKDDIQMAALLNSDGVVFGCLTSDNKLDKDKMKQLIDLARSLNLEIVMHMAFDEIAPEQWEETIDWLAKHGIKRILTHGGPLSQSMFNTIPNLRKVIDLARNKIEILPGGGINSDNLFQVDKLLHCDQYHGSKII